MRFGDQTYEELAGLAEDPHAVAVVPTGCTEQQGPHLTVDFDTWLVEEVCVAASSFAAKRSATRSVVLPALPFGPTPEHRNYAHGFIDIPQHLHEEMIAAVLESLADQGFRCMLVWRGCGQHQLQTVIDAFNYKHAGRARATQPDLPYHEIWCSVADPDVPGGHADSFATSLALYLREDHVRTDRISDPHGIPVDWSRPDLDFRQYSATGVIGDPTHASPELGKKLWREIVNHVAHQIQAASTAQAR